jgi:hypothetical protein
MSPRRTYTVGRAQRQYRQVYAALQVIMYGQGAEGADVPVSERGAKEVEIQG